ncbi:MAG: thiamine-phosphate kinase [Parvibaculum sp.]
MERQGKSDGGSERPGEFELIETLFAPLTAKAAGAYALKDDAALYSAQPGYETVLTVDAMVEGVHFLSEDPPEDISRKLLRVNLSDLAAKGAVPKGYLLVAGWRRDTPLEWIKKFCAGLSRDQEVFDVSLWGGDTVVTPGPLTFSLTAVGEVPSGRMIHRSGARAGDAIYVTGTIGDSALGLMMLQGGLDIPDEGQAAHLASRYRRPEPRTTFGPRLCGVAHAALDVSDGLMADLGHICEVSGTGARIELDLVPLSEAARAALGRRPGLVEQIASGGDDYEILFTIAPERAAAVAAIAREAGVPATRIGTILERSEGVTAVDASGNRIPLKQLGYRHF